MESKKVSPYTFELLDSILKTGNATLCETYTKFNQRMQISYLCKCGVKASKRFEMLRVHRMPYCKECSYKEHENRKEISCLKKYNVVNVFCIKENKEKMNETWLQKYGGHPKRNKEVQDKWKETCLLKYGGHPNQNVDVQAKSEASSYAYKEYIMPSGNTVKYQGYENLALDELVKIYPENDISVGRANVPTICYHINDIKHIYFPDFFIKSENKIIEIKSEWTLQLKKGNVEEKAHATVNAGYNYEIWVYNDKKVKVDIKVY